MFRFLSIAAIIFLAGCESQFDKCFVAELGKIRTAEQQAIDEHPVLAAYAKLDEFSEQISEVTRIDIEVAVQTGPEPEHCKTQSYPKDAECNAWFDGLMEASKAALESAGYPESSSVIESQLQAYKAEFDYVFPDDSDSRLELREKLGNAEATFNELYANLADDDVDGKVQCELDRIQLRREIFEDEILAQILIINAEEIAVETCNQRGLYK